MSLLKKKTEVVTSLSTAWHPNFRNYECLPDVKVVRTAFFLNGIALAFASGLLLFFLYREYSVRLLDHDIATAQEAIKRDKPGSETAVKRFREFQSEEKKIVEINEFIQARPLASAIFAHMGETLPKNIALNYIELGNRSLTLRGVVRGAPEVAPADAAAYEASLGRDKQMQALFDKVSLVSVRRNQQTGFFDIELVLNLRGAKK